MFSTIGSITKLFNKIINFYNDYMRRKRQRKRQQEMDRLHDDPKSWYNNKFDGNQDDNDNK